MVTDLEDTFEKLLFMKVQTRHYLWIAYDIGRPM